MVKIPSRVTTFVEMALGGSKNGTEHVLPLRVHEAAFPLSLHACDLRQEDCAATFSFTKSARLKLFRGAPTTPSEVETALVATLAPF